VFGSHGSEYGANPISLRRARDEKEHSAFGADCGRFGSRPLAPAAFADDMKKDTMSKDTMSKDSMKKDDGMAKDNMKK
jgi:hypothetical protein